MQLLSGITPVLLTGHIPLASGSTTLYPLRAKRVRFYFFLTLFIR